MLITTSRDTEIIATASISIVNMELVGCGGIAGGFATGAFDTWATGLARG